MRAISMSIVGLVLAAAGATASAAIVGPIDTSGFHTLDGGFIPSSTFQTRGVPGTNFSVFTGIATAAGGLTLLEPTAPPVRDDVVTLGTTGEAINDYIAAAGSVQRSVSSAVSTSINGFDLVTVSIAGRDSAGAPADLWPSGFVNGSGTPLTSGGVGIGLNLPASLGGVSPMLLAPQNFVNRLTVEIITGGVSSGEIVLPNTFYGGGPVNPWTGVLGVSFGNGATGTGVQSDIIIRIELVPAPASAALLGLGGLFAARRRRA